MYDYSALTYEPLAVSLMVVCALTKVFYTVIDLYACQTYLLHYFACSLLFVCFKLKGLWQV